MNVRMGAHAQACAGGHVDGAHVIEEYKGADCPLTRVGQDASNDELTQIFFTGGEDERDSGSLSHGGFLEKKVKREGCISELGDAPVR